MGRRIATPPRGMDYDDLECFEERQCKSSIAAQRMLLVELLTDEQACEILRGRLQQHMIVLPDSLGRH